MLKVEDWVSIRKFKENNPGIGNRKIARYFKVSRNTVKKALAEDKPPEYTRAEKPNPKIEPFQEYIFEKINVKKLKGSRVLADIRSKGYLGSERAFYNYLQKIRHKEEKVFRRYETSPGEQAQFDWSPYSVRIGGIITKVKIFCYLLGYSRYRVYEASLSETQGSIFEALECGIQQTEGVPERVQTDNAKSFVVNASVENFQWNTRYLHFCGYYKFMPTRSLPGHPWSKGKVENPFSYLENHFILDNEFTDFKDLQSKLKNFQKEVNLRIHSTTRKTPKELFDYEKAYLNKLPSARYIGVKEEARTATSDCLIVFKSNRYSVPKIFARREVWIKVSKGYLLEIYSSNDTLIAVHELSLGKGKVIIDPEHFKNHRIERGNWARLEQEFTGLFPEAVWFLEKLKTQKRISATYHLTQIVYLSRYYSTKDIICAFNESAKYNTFNYNFIKGMLEINAKRTESVTRLNEEIIKTPVDIKRPLNQYKLF